MERPPYYLNSTDISRIWNSILASPLLSGVQSRDLQRPFSRTFRPGLRTFSTTVILSYRNTSTHSGLVDLYAKRSWEIPWDEFATASPTTP